MYIINWPIGLVGSMFTNGEHATKGLGFNPWLSPTKDSKKGIWSLLALHSAL